MPTPTGNPRMYQEGDGPRPGSAPSSVGLWTCLLPPAAYFVAGLTAHETARPHSDSG